MGDVLDSSHPELRAAKGAKIASLLNELGQTIQDGAAEEDAWGAVFSAVRERMAATSMEHRRLVEMQQLMSIEEAAAIVVAVTEAVKRVFPDQKVQQQIAAEIDRNLTVNSVRRLPAPPLAAADQ